LHQLAASFVLGYHGCNHSTGERLLKGEAFRPSQNAYDWLGPGIYFWEANPKRGLQFAREAARRSNSKVAKPFVVGAVISMGHCLDLTTTAGVEWVRTAYEALAKFTAAGLREEFPQNKTDSLLRPLDCAVIQMVHSIRKSRDEEPIDTVKGIFIEGEPVYPTSGFYEKTHIQIAVCNPECIKGVFRVPQNEL
jgi:hypothetical protein